MDDEIDLPPPWRFVNLYEVGDTVLWRNPYTGGGYEALVTEKVGLRLLLVVVWELNGQQALVDFTVVAPLGVL